MEWKCFAVHLVANCSKNPNRGQKVSTSEPTKKEQNMSMLLNKKDPSLLTETVLGHASHIIKRQITMAPI